MSMVTDRVVLSSIDDNRLNSSFNKGIIPLLPNSKSKSKSNSLSRTNSKLTSSRSDLRTHSDLRSSLNANSFKLFEGGDHDTDVDEASSQKFPQDYDDDGVSAYASKLKFKLKMAIRKLNQQNKLPHSPTKFSPSLSNSSTKLYNKSKSAINYKSLSQRKVSKPFSFKNSVNINLTKQNANKILSKSPLKHSFNLNSFIMDKQSKKPMNQAHLKLFTIKKDSPFYNNQKLPLTVNQASNTYTNMQDSVGDGHGNNGASNQLSVNSLYDMQSKNVSDTSLPPINKILKTPLKLTSVNGGSSSHPNSNAQNNEDNDLTIDDVTIDESNKKCNSSPLKHFATPNSFSVAKSLLQLGSGYYN